MNKSARESYDNIRQEKVYIIKVWEPQFTYIHVLYITASANWTMQLALAVINGTYVCKHASTYVRTYMAIRMYV